MLCTPITRRLFAESSAPHVYWPPTAPSWRPVPICPVTPAQPHTGLSALTEPTGLQSHAVSGEPTVVSQTPLSKSSSSPGIFVDPSAPASAAGDVVLSDEQPSTATATRPAANKR